MSRLDDPRPDFAADDPWLHILLGVASFTRTLEARLPPPRFAAADREDPGVLVVLGVVALARLLAAALPAAAPAAPPVQPQHPPPPASLLR